MADDAQRGAARRSAGNEINEIRKPTASIHVAGLSFFKTRLGLVLIEKILKAVTDPCHVIARPNGTHRADSALLVDDEAKPSVSPSGGSDGADAILSDEEAVCPDGVKRKEDPRTLKRFVGG
jgi:hypothetical protein